MQCDIDFTINSKIFCLSIKLWNVCTNQYALRIVLLWILTTDFQKAAALLFAAFTISFYSDREISD